MMTQVFEDIQSKVRRGNKIVISKKSPLLDRLVNQLQDSSHRELIIWALELASQTAEQFSSEKIVIEAIDTCWLWAQGRIKMPEAKSKILACHRLAKNCQNKSVCAKYHAIAQACSVVHTPKHALGFPLYELSAIVLDSKDENFVPLLLKRVDDYCNVLSESKKKALDLKISWAQFIHG